MLIANVVRAIVGAIVNKIATVAVNATSAFINSCMKGKNPLEQNAVHIRASVLIQFVATIKYNNDYFTIAQHAQLVGFLH